MFLLTYRDPSQVVPQVVRIRTWLGRIGAATLLSICLVTDAVAQRAALLVDAKSGAVLYAKNAQAPAYPASLTKLMTLYVLFEALATGKVSLDSSVQVSKNAARQPPVKLGLKVDSTITVDEAIDAMIITSANDVAVAVAEMIAGSHEAFVALMNNTARTLGMAETHFTNASGLPDTAQTTTARDLALMAIALKKSFPDRNHRFSRKSFTFKGRQFNTHNNFVRSFPGAEGFKTGFTCHAGFNLVAAASRDGQQIIGVILGEATAAVRDANMTRMMRQALTGKFTSGYPLDALPNAADQGHDTTINHQMIATECISPERHRQYVKVSDWTIELGLELTRADAIKRARQFIRTHRGLLKGGRPLLIPRWTRQTIYQVGITGLKQAHAVNTCLTVRTDRVYCVVLPPKLANYHLERALRVMTAIKNKQNAAGP